MTEKRYRKVVTQAKRAEVGDSKAPEKLRRLCPEAYDRLLEAYGDLGRRTEDALIEAIYLQRWGNLTKGNHLSLEGVKRKADEMRRELYEFHRSPLERLLVDRLICCWIGVCHAEMAAAGYADHLVSGDDRFQKWLDRCHRRFLRACKDLATVHKLLGPTIQVNIGKEQKIANVFPPMQSKTV